MGLEHIPQQCATDEARIGCCIELDQRAVLDGVVGRLLNVRVHVVPCDGRPLGECTPPHDDPNGRAGRRCRAFQAARDGHCPQRVAGPARVLPPPKGRVAPRALPRGQQPKRTRGRRYGRRDSPWRDTSSAVSVRRASCKEPISSPLRANVSTARVWWVRLPSTRRCATVTVRGGRRRAFQGRARRLFEGPCRQGPHTSVLTPQGRSRCGPRPTFSQSCQDVEGGALALRGISRHSSGCRKQSWSHPPICALTADDRRGPVGDLGHLEHVPEEQVAEQRPT